MQKIIGKKFEKIKFIEEGGQAKIFLVKNVDDKKDYALKIIKSSKNDELERFRKEIEFLKKIKSPYVVKVFFFGKEKKPYYVMEFAKHGTLKSNRYYVGNLKFCLNLFERVCKGVQAIHESGVIHRDIRPSNILLAKSKEDVKISDFGLACSFEKRKGIRKKIGAPYFSAPEEKKHPARPVVESDFFSLGKLLYYMVTGKIPKEKSFFLEENSFQKELNEFIKFMCAKDFQNRPSSAKEVLQLIKEIKKNHEKTLQKWEQ